MIDETRWQKHKTEQETQRHEAGDTGLDLSSDWIAPAYKQKYSNITVV